MRTKKVKEDQKEVNGKEFKAALEYIVNEKGIDEDTVIEAMQTALSTGPKFCLFFRIHCLHLLRGNIKML